MVKENDLGWGMGTRERECLSGCLSLGKGLSPGLGSVFYTNAIPKLIKLDLRAVTG